MALKVFTDNVFLRLPLISLKKKKKKASAGEFVVEFNPLENSRWPRGELQYGLVWRTKIPAQIIRAKSDRFAVLRAVNVCFWF